MHMAHTPAGKRDILAMTVELMRKLLRLEDQGGLDSSLVADDWRIVASRGLTEVAWALALLNNQCRVL